MRHWLLCSVAAFICGLVASLGCQKKNEFVPPPPPTVTAARPVTRSIADSIEFRSKLEATETVVLRARVNGYLEKVEFEDGTDVVQGQELFLIEQAPYIAALNSAKATLQKAEAERELAQSQYKRMEPLVAQRAITQDELDIQQAQVSTALADVAAAQAAIQTAELNLKYTVIRAPIAGHIGRHLVDIGNLVQAEQTELAVIQSIDPLYGTFDVNERDLLRFMAMLRAQTLPDPDKNPPKLFLALDNEIGFPHEGKLAFRELGLDPGTATAFRRGLFPNPGRQMLPGMAATIRAQVGEALPRLLVDERAIGADQRGNYLLVVGPKNVVEYRPVKLGMSSGGMRVIESGIKADDLVIVNGIQRARPGAPVSPQQTEMTSAETEAAAPPTATKPQENSKEGTQPGAAPKQEAANAAPQQPPTEAGATVQKSPGTDQKK